MLHSDFASRYYARLARPYELVEVTVRVLLLLSSGAVFASLVASWAPRAQPFIAAAAALLSLVILVAGLGKKADKCTELQKRFAALCDRYEQIWDRMERGDETWTEDFWRAREQANQCQADANRLPVFERFRAMAKKEMMNSRRLVAS